MIFPNTSPAGDRKERDHGPKAVYAKPRGMESGIGRSGEGRRLPADIGRAGCAAGPRGRDGRDLGGGKRRAHGEPAWLSQRPLFGDIDHARREVGIAGAAGSARAFPDGVVRAVSTQREGAGGALAEMYV